MANGNPKNLHILTTCLSFDLTNEDDLAFYTVLKALGSSAKLFIKTSVYTVYANEISILSDNDGTQHVEITGKTLNEQVETYKKKYIKSEFKDIVFINWNKKDFFDMTCFLILSQLEGGLQDFLMNLFKECYPFFFKKGITLPAYVKKTHKKAVDEIMKKTDSATKLNKIKDTEYEEFTSDSDKKLSEEPASDVSEDEELELMEIITNGFDA